MKGVKKRRITISTAQKEVRNQQGRVLTDSDWNEQILLERARALIKKILIEIKRNRVRSDRVLFVGDSADEKTLAAQFLATELGMDLFRINLATAMNKYIGETEKNLDGVFKVAAQSDVILFFDEADALFGKRTEVIDAHDRYANIEASYLLQKIEKHQGVVILSSDLPGNIDSEFIWPVDIRVQFPSRSGVIYADVWERPVTTLQDETLLKAGLSGPDTETRSKPIKFFKRKIRKKSW